ncbi:MAG TPA: hypothetical protein VKD21_04465 [Acidimicrobiales bacterium]|nr:hypothetical protein [Acidimicrobiales bacterium]
MASARDTALQQVYQDALASGLDEEGARAAVAVAATEGGYTGNLGDNGQSAGTFQLYSGGQLPGYASSQGMGTQQAIAYLQRNPHAANRWALSGYLGNAIRRGQQAGLRGPGLATYAQQHGQVSVSPERAGQNYQQIFSPGGPKVQLSVQAGGSPVAVSETAKRIQAQLAEKRRQLEVLKNRVDVLDQPATGEAASDEDLDKQRLARLRQVRSEMAETQNDIDRLEKEESAEADKAAKAEAAPARVTASDGTVYERQPDGTWLPATGLPSGPRATAPKATRTYTKGGVTVSETESDTGGFQPLPEGVYDPATQMTAYQTAELPIQRQNAASSALGAAANYLSAQVQQGRLSYEQGVKAFDYIRTLMPSVDVGGQKYAYGFTPTEAGRGLRAPAIRAGPDLTPEDVYKAVAGPGGSPAGQQVTAGAAGGFQPQPQQPQPTPQGPSVPQFGSVGALLQQQQSLDADIDKTRQLLLSKGYPEQVADAAARRLLGAGRTAGQTPF